MKRTDIYPGFILVNENGTIFRAVNHRDKLHLMSSNFTVSSKPISEMMDENLNPINDYLQIVIINDRYGNTVWRKPVEFTMQAIADKFGIPVEQLKIKK